MDAKQLLNELESELAGRRGLFSKKVDFDKCAEIVYRLKEAVPKSVYEAEYVMLNRRKILESADSAAQNTIKEAEERAVHIVENSELIRRAETEADKIFEAAERKCDALVAKTKSHLDGMFKDIEQFLLSAIAMIRNNREELRAAAVNGRK
jgi:F0F1-type ATP synthase membrane subunit b/b'